MANFIALAYTITAGIVVFLATLAAFGCAMKRRHIAIAPRCTARPKDTIYNPNPKGKDCQDRGGPMLGWIAWSLSLTFEEMLNGIPGTGTRKGGLEGSLLKVNLDSIILIRFHDLCLKVCFLTTLLAVFIVLPLNWTAPNPNREGSKLTDYDLTTLANVPPISADSEVSMLSRLYVIVFCSWIISFYSVYLIGEEWRENLRLRRSYYLEADHHLNRKNELENTIGAMTEEDFYDIHQDPYEADARNPFIRDPWIPHPEQRDTVPNIELYSVLVNNLPSLPSEVMDHDYHDSVFRRQAIDWQLGVATAFFDHIVPNQPGFSSSVAAITILPSAPQIAKAWRKWYVAAGALRRLTYIRSLIAKRRHYDIEVPAEDDIGPSPNQKTWGDTGQLQPNQNSSQLYADDYAVQNYEKNFGLQNRDSFHDLENLEAYHKFFEDLNYGPEQTAIYTREFAQGAAACCPYGCNDHRLEAADFDELLELEKDAIARVQAANIVLKETRKQAVPEQESTRKDGSQHDSNRLMKSDIEMQVLQPSIQHRRTSSLNDSSVCFPVELPEKLQVESEILAKFGKFSNVSSSDISNDKLRRGNSDTSNDNGQQSLWSSGEVISSSRSLPPKNIAFPLNENIPKHPPAPTNRHLNRRISGTSELTASQNSSSVNDIMRTTIAESPPNNSLSQRVFNQQTPSLPTRALSFGAQPKRTSGKKIAPTYTLNNTGKFVLLSFDEDDLVQGSSVSSNHSTQTLNANSLNNFDDNSEVSFRSLFPISTQSRRRLNSGNSNVGTATGTKFEQIRENDEISYHSTPQRISSEDSDTQKEIHASGKLFSRVWFFPTYEIPSFRDFRALVSQFVRDLFGVRTVVNKLARENTVAIVTFTSRQAAVAARHSLADGRGVQRWVADSRLPVPPLADAASCDLKTCRGCCRPVTNSINKRQKLMRKCTSMTILILLFIFYIFPINLATSFFNEDKLIELFPGLLLIEDNVIFSDLLSGLVQGLLLTLFFSVAPQIFKMISNFGSNAISVISAERRAMKYYWWFMVITAFSGNSILTATLDAFNEGQIDDNVVKILTTIGDAVPTKVSATWINWIILRTTMVLPIQYLLQVNTFIFYFLGWNCCARCVMGGGPGGQTPYRIYIDSGVVFMCNVALSFAAPLTAPCALAYFLLCAPLWRRNSIFLYRPKFDGGGMRWPFLSDELISSLIVGQILLVTMMSLREAPGPAIMAGAPLIPTLIYRNTYRARYYKAFIDAALLQTSLLDGWDNTIPSSMEKREDFRQFLVDAHKAAYIPISIASYDTSPLTAQPAMVVPKDGDVGIVSDFGSDEYTEHGHETITPFTPKTDQLGVSMRRLATAPIPKFDGMKSMREM